MERVFPAAGDVADMPSRSLGALLALAICLAVVAPVTGLTGQGPLSTGGSDAAVVTPEPTATPDDDTRRPSEVTMRVQLRPNGDARWRVTATFPIRNEEDAEGFDELAADFEDDSSPLGLDSFRRAAEEASAETGREMELRNVTRSHERTGAQGRLMVAFTWSNFARTEGSRLVVGDAFNTTDGTWLPWLLEDETLLIAPPSGYGIEDAPEVGFVGGAARWVGPRVFVGREPWIVYSSAVATPTSTATPTATPTTPGGGPGTGTSPATETPDGFFSSVFPVALLVLVAGASAAVLAVYMRREDEGTGSTATESGGDGGTTPGTSPTTDDGAASDGASATESGVDDGTDDINEALLSDEERVERLLERSGGRMKQADIVKETGWSNAKVSQLLSAMAESDRVDKLRIGRENLISFPDEDVTDLGSDDEA